MPQEILNYRIEREIGEGGMSRVYKGVDPKTGQQVAIKELLPHLSHHDEVRQRFCREAQVMAILNHPHIVRLIRYEEVGDNLYLVQEYVDGMNLARYVGEHRGALPEADAIRLFRQILEALSYAHEAGVVHRDIKPSNILLTPIGDVKILDFGIARIVGDESGGFRTKTGTRIGTVVYMSPEQVNAKADIDHRSDIYSAGVLLHHMLTGRAPYDMGTDSEFEVQMKIVKEPLPRMLEINPGVSEQMQRIVDKATAKGRDARYQSCGAFLQALYEQRNPVVDPITPVPPPPPLPNPSFTKIAIILLMGLCGLLAVYYSYTNFYMGDGFLNKIDKAINEKKYYSPPNENVWDYLNEKRNEQPESPEILTAIKLIEKKLLPVGDEAINRLYLKSDDTGWDETVNVFKLLHEVIPDDNDIYAKTEFSQAHQIIKRKSGVNYYVAFDKYKKALELKPDWVLALNGIAKIYIRKDSPFYDKEQALFWYGKVCAVDQNFPWAYTNIAAIYMEDEIWYKAEQSLLQALKIKKDSPSIYTDLGKVYEQQKKYAEALDCYRKAMGYETDEVKILKLQKKISGLNI